MGGISDKWYGKGRDIILNNNVRFKDVALHYWLYRLLRYPVPLSIGVPLAKEGAYPLLFLYENYSWVTLKIYSMFFLDEDGDYEDTDFEGLEKRVRLVLHSPELFVEKLTLLVEELKLCFQREIFPKDDDSQTYLCDGSESVKSLMTMLPEGGDAFMLEERYLNPVFEAKLIKLQDSSIFVEAINLIEVEMQVVLD